MRLLMIGGGGHCRSILDCVLRMGTYDDVGIVDFDSSASALGIPVVGTDDDLPDLLRDGWTHAFVSVGSVGSTALRRKLYQMVKDTGFEIPSIVDPSAQIAGGTEIGEGVFIGKLAVVNTGSRIGKCAIINTGAIVEHDCLVGDFSHISPGGVLCGQVTVGSDSHVGAGAVVRQQTVIGSRSIVGAGSVVVKDIPENVTAYGNPCKVIVR